MTDPIVDNTFLEHAAVPLALLHATGLGLNVGAALRAFRRGARWTAGAWAALAVVFAVLACAALVGSPVGWPEAFKTAFDRAVGPATLTIGTFALLAIVYRFRAFFADATVASAAFNATWIWLGLSLVDPQFARLALDGDHIPIIALLYLLGGALWLALAGAVDNDRRITRGERPHEAIDAEENFLVWPDLVAVELVAIVAVLCVLVAWSMLVPAPLEAPADPMATPNPSKAPWYFAGLQELLVYFDPALAGVVFPLTILFGLCAIPYLDPNTSGTGHYTIHERRFAIGVFVAGFVGLWVLLIVIGVFFRGPNWAFCGLYAVRDPNVFPPFTNITLAELFWARLLGMQLSTSMALREAPGLLLLAAYYIAVPWTLARTKLRAFRERLGPTRYSVVMLLLLTMLAIPLKMLLHWTLHLSYVVNFPEWSLKI